MTGLPLILTSKFIINDIFGPSLGDSTVAIAAAFPALLSTGNLVGRLLWGTLSDRIGCASTLALFGISVPALMLAPVATTMVPHSPHDAMRAAMKLNLSPLTQWAYCMVSPLTQTATVTGVREPL